VSPFVRRVVAEFLGTGLLVTAVIGSGIAAAGLSPGDIGLELFENAFATALALAVLILVFAPVSGAHFNPVVTLADWWLRRRDRHWSAGHVGGYVAAQTLGAVGGAILANLMFSLPAVTWSQTTRSGGHLWLGEIVATAGLIFVIFALVRTGRTQLAPLAVGGYIGAAYWFTSSTSFANPAVTIGRAFTDTFAGIAPASLPGFVAAQLIGALLGIVAVALIYPRPASEPIVTPVLARGGVPATTSPGWDAVRIMPMTGPPSDPNRST
jgi:glycerol uptake facilitator-like aquaporin